MGPPPFGSGNFHILGVLVGPSLTSMGPPPFGSGNMSSSRWTTSSSSRLQWGHRLSVVETVQNVRLELVAGRLQWGHRLSVVETTQRASWGVNFRILQWGHRLSVVETLELAVDFVWSERLQWGHRLSVVETALYGSLTSRIHPDRTVFRKKRLQDKWRRRGSYAGLPSIG